MKDATGNAENERAVPTNERGERLLVSRCREIAKQIGIGTSVCLVREQNISDAVDDTRGNGHDETPDAKTLDTSTKAPGAESGSGFSEMGVGTPGSQAECYSSLTTMPSFI